MNREEHLAQRQQTFQLAGDFTRALGKAYEAISSGKPAAETEALANEALSVGEDYGGALDKLLALVEAEPGNNTDEIERVIRFKELLRKEQDILKSHSHVES